MDSRETKILRALENKAVDKYEAFAVVERLRNSFFSNTGFVSEIRNVKIEVAKLGYVSSLTMDVLVEFPDNKTMTQGTAKISYTCDGKRFRVERSKATPLKR